MAKPGISSTLIGARMVEQLKGNLVTASLVLANEQMTRLNEVRASTPGFSAGLASPAILQMVSEGSDVRGWAE